MSKTKPQATAPDERVPMAEPAGGWPPDEFTGVAGSFVRDPFTGQRSPAEPEAAAEDQPQAAA